MLYIDCECYLDYLYKDRPQFILPLHAFTHNYDCLWEEMKKEYRIEGNFRGAKYSWFLWLKI